MKKQGTKTAVFNNKVLNQNYTLGGVIDLDHAWKMMTWACARNGWNHIDVTVKIS